MMDTTVRAAMPADVDEVIAVFRSSRLAAMPWLPVLHTPDEDTAYFSGQLAGPSSWVAVAQDRVVGFAVCSPGWLDHLYVRPDLRGMGVGSTLLARAKQDQPDGLDLWVFERNVPAQEFYLRHGFSEVRRTDGRDNEERTPDIQMRWPGA